METANAIMQELEQLGSAQTRKIFTQHGGPSSMFGVKIADLKTIVKRVKKNYELAKDLYDTGNSDAMYLAGLIGDEKKMSKADLNHWVENSTWHMISEYTVPFVAAESPYGWELALEWIDSEEEKIAASGWTTLAGIVSIIPDDKLDMKVLDQLIKRVETNIHAAPNRARYSMNCFLLSLGAYVIPFTEKVKAVAKKIGTVSVDMRGSACHVPDIISYLEKIESRNKIGKKKKTARC